MKLEEILKASVCAFCENTFENYSLEDTDFIEALDYYITSNNLEERIKEYAYEINYDFDNITNVSNSLKCQNKDWSYADIMNSCRQAYIATIINNKTINLESFVDNVAKEFNKMKI